MATILNQAKKTRKQIKDTASKINKSVMISQTDDEGYDHAIGVFHDKAVEARECAKTAIVMIEDTMDMLEKDSTKREEYEKEKQTIERYLEDTAFIEKR